MEGGGEEEATVPSVHEAAATGDLEELTKLVNQDASLRNARDDRSKTAMHWAAEYGHAHIVQFLIERGADVNLKDDQGCTALVCACLWNFRDVAMMLLKRGADPTLTDKHGSNALIYAAYCAEPEVVHALLKDGRVSVDQANYKGETALWEACYCNLVEVARLLVVEGGADPSLADKQGRTPLAIAMEKGHQECVDLLEGVSKAKVEKVKQAHRARVEALAVGCSSHRRPASQSPDLLETAVDEAEEAQQETATGSCGGGCCSGGVLGKKNGGCGAAAGAEAAPSPTACNGSTGRGKESGESCNGGNNHFRAGSNCNGCCVLGGGGEEGSRETASSHCHGLMHQGRADSNSPLEGGGGQHHHLHPQQAAQQQHMHPLLPPHLQHIHPSADEPAPYDRVVQWRHIQGLQRKLVAEITAYKNSAHADSATKKQLRFSKNTTRKELKDAWAYFEKREREQAALVDGSESPELERRRMGYIVYPYHPEIHADRISYLGLMLSEMETWRDGLTPDRLAELEREGEMIREELSALLKTKTREDFKAAGGVMGPMPGGGINSPSSVSDLLSLRMPCSQPISQDGTGRVKATAEPYHSIKDPGSTLVGGSSNHHLSNNKKVHHQFSTAHLHSSSPFRSSSAGSLHRNHSFDRLVSLAPGPSTPPTTYSSPFTTYSPPLNYRHTLASSSAAPPFHHDPTALLASAMQHGLALRGNAAATRGVNKAVGNGSSYVQTAHNNISSRMLLMQQQQQQQQQARGGRGDSSAAFRAPGGPIVADGGRGRGSMMMGLRHDEVHADQQAVAPMGMASSLGADLGPPWLMR